MLAERFLVGYALGAVGLGGWIIVVEGFTFLLPMVLAAPFSLGRLILAGRSVPTIIYVRARLKAEHGEPFSVLPSHLMHAAALGIALVLGAPIPRAAGLCRTVGAYWDKGYLASANRTRPNTST